MMESGRVNSVRGRPSEDRVKRTGGTGNRVKTQQEKEGAEKNRDGKQSMGGLRNCCIGLLVVGRCQALSGITPARQYN